jgi:V8-like Glu-specific endopeptidase
MKMPRHFVLFALALAGFASQSVLALPLANSFDNAAKKSAPSASEIADAGVDFTAIIALNNCSGSLVRYTTSLPGDNALILTNGHCYEGGMPRPGAVVVNRPSTRSFRLLSSNAASTLATFRATELVYATMTDSDVAIYKVSNTYAEIEAAYGVQALTISADHPAAGAPIKIVSGYWKKIYTCQIDDFVYKLEEAGWIFKDAIRYSTPGCETIGGTSGSPIIHADTKEVIGINNTGNEDGQRCTMNNPCEIDEAGNVTVRHQASYGQQLYLIYTCLNDSNNLDLNIEGCKLAKPVATEVTAEN